MELQSLVDKVKGLTGPQQARVGAIVGALVADAAVQPIHWIYDKEAMKRAVAACPDAPEFLPVSANPFYTLPTGSQSVYGDQLVVMLESLVECSGFIAKKNAEKMYQNFGPNSPYDNTGSSLYKKGQVDRSYPIQGKWKNFLVRRFVDCHGSEGAGTVEASIHDDTNVDPDNLIRNIPLVALLAGKKAMLDTLQDSILQLQCADLMVAVVTATSRILERYILCGSGESGTSEVHPIERVCQDLRRPDRACPDPLDTAMVSYFNEVLKSKSMSVEAASAKFGVS